MILPSISTIGGAFGLLSTNVPTPKTLSQMNSFLSDIGTVHKLFLPLYFNFLRICGYEGSIVGLMELTSIDNQFDIMIGVSARLVHFCITIAIPIFLGVQNFYPWSSGRGSYALISTYC